MVSTVQVTDGDERIGLERASNELGDLLSSVAATKQRVVIEKDGQAVGALISLADLQRLRAFDQRRELAIARLRRIGDAFKDCDPDEVEREAIKATAEVRAEMYAERLARGG